MILSLDLTSKIKDLDAFTILSVGGKQQRIP
jgi:hypothetical protein